MATRNQCLRAVEMLKAAAAMAESIRTIAQTPESTYIRLIGDRIAQVIEDQLEGLQESLDVMDYVQHEEYQANEH